MLTLKRLFRLIGFSIATYPLAYFIAAAIMTSLSGGIYFLKMEDRVRDGYTQRLHRQDTKLMFSGNFYNQLVSFSHEKRAVCLTALSL